MQNLQDGWYVKREYQDASGNYHTETSEYMSKTKAEDYCNLYNANTNNGTAYLEYDTDFDL